MSSYITILYEINLLSRDDLRLKPLCKSSLFTDGFFGVLLLLCLLLIGCETPNSPSFTTRQAVDTPVLFNKKLTFLGGPNSLIDTTNSNFDSLFAVDEEGLVSLVVNEDVEFENLGDIIPRVTIVPKNVVASLGTITFNHILTGNNGAVAEASSGDFSTFSIPDQAEGEPVPPGQFSSVTLEIETEHILEAVVNEGTITLEMENDLGFDIEEMTLQLQGDGNDIGQEITINNFKDGTVELRSLQISESTTLKQPFSAEVQIRVENQKGKKNKGSFKINRIIWENLKMSRLEGIVQSQTITKNEFVEIGSEEFEFTSEEDFLEIKSGELILSNIQNNIDLALNSVAISSPDLLIPPSSDAPPTQEDSLLTNFQVDRKEQNAGTRRIDLAGAVFQSDDTTIRFNIKAVSENTADDIQGNKIRTVTSDDTFSLDIEANNLQIKAARGLIKPRLVHLNGDDPANGENLLDLFNTTEAEIVNIEDLEDISKQAQGLRFLNPTMTLRYKTNIGVKNTIFGAMIGINSEGDRAFLSGLDGGPFDVQPTDDVTGFLMDNAPIPKDQWVKFNVLPSQNGVQEASVTFNKENTSIIDFISNIPVDIHFISKSLVNPDSNNGLVREPVLLDVNLAIGVPLNVATDQNPVIMNDTSDVADVFEELPKEGDNSQIAEAVLHILYTNSLPLQTDLTIEFIDNSSGVAQPVLILPANPEDKLTLLAAEVDPESRFVNSEQEGTLTVKLDNQQALALQKTDLINLKGNFTTTDNEGVKIRSQDAVEIRIGFSFKIESDVN